MIQVFDGDGVDRSKPGRTRLDELWVVKRKPYDRSEGTGIEFYAGNAIGGIRLFVSTAATAMFIEEQEAAEMVRDLNNDRSNSYNYFREAAADQAMLYLRHPADRTYFAGMEYGDGTPMFGEFDRANATQVSARVARDYGSLCNALHGFKPVVENP